MTLRKSIWGDKSPSGRDVGEALRDHDATLRAIPDTKKIEGSFTYAPPIYLRSSRVPTQVNVVRARLDKAPGAVASGAVDWSWNQSSGVKVNSIAGLTANTRYLLTFELVY